MYGRLLAEGRTLRLFPVTLRFGVLAALAVAAFAVLWGQGASAATLVAPFGDMTIADGATRDIAMTDHFSGEGLTYEVLVTTTHQGTGVVRTAPLNQVGVNKVTGEWSGAVLTLTGGDAVPQDLTLRVTATDSGGARASGEFVLSLVIPPQEVDVSSAWSDGMEVGAQLRSISTSPPTWLGR